MLMGEYLRTVQFLLETNKGENTFKFWSFVLNRENEVGMIGVFMARVLYIIILSSISTIFYNVEFDPGSG